MDAEGRLEGDRVSFVSRGRERLIRQDCPSSDSRYAPDRFHGRIDRMRDTFRAVNNDGAFDIDEPYTFRRTSCE
jgi:hypothetical protein